MQVTLLGSEEEVTEPNPFDARQWRVSRTFASSFLIELGNIADAIDNDETVPDEVIKFFEAFERWRERKSAPPAP